MPHAYTIGAVVAAIVAVGIDILVTRSRVVLMGRFWITVVIVSGFQILVDGWLTKLSAPIVIYSPHHYLGIRVFFSSPIEDFIYGFALLTITISWWVRLR